MAFQIRPNIHLLLAVVAATAFAWILFGQQSTVTAAQTNFVGGTPSRPDSSDIRALRLRCEPGTRSNWHSHPNWQILMAEGGRGRTQIRGEEIVELVPGRPVPRWSKCSALARCSPRRAHGATDFHQR